MAIKKIVPKKKITEEVEKIEEKIGEKAEEVKEKAAEIKEEMKEKVTEAEEKVEEKATKVKEEAKTKAAEVEEKAEKKADEAEKQIEEKEEEVKDFVEEKSKKVSTKAKEGEADDEKGEVPKNEPRLKKEKELSEKQRKIDSFKNRTLTGLIETLDGETQEIGIYSKDLEEVVYMPYELYGNTNATFVRANELLKKEIKFNIKKMDENGKVYVSSKEYALKRIEELRDKEVDLVYLYRLRYGALFKIKDEPIVGFLANNKYSNIPHLKIESVLSKDDEIKAILDYVGPEGKVGFNAENIEGNPLPVQKYKREDYSEGKIFAGKISGITEKGIFVNLDLNLDALAYTTNYMSDIPLYIGKEVLFKVENVIDDEDGTFRVRGRVTGELD